MYGCAGRLRAEKRRPSAVSASFCNFVGVIVSSFFFEYYLQDRVKTFEARWPLRLELATPEAAMSAFSLVRPRPPLATAHPSRTPRT